MKKFKLDKKDKKIAICIFTAFIAIATGLSGSSLYMNYRADHGLGHTEKAYLNRYSTDKNSEDHEAVTDINGETPNEFAAKVKQANQSDTGTESKVLVNTPVGEEERLSNMVKDMNAVSYDTYTVVRFDDDSDKELFVKNMEYSKYDYQDDGTVQIAGIGGFPVPSYSEETALPVSDTPAKDAHDQGKLLVAVIDTGCGTEADSSVNFTTDSDADNNGHGTAMAKIIKEKSDGKAYILSLKAIGDNGEGSISNVTAAVKYAIEQGADIINMSIIAKDSDNMAAFKSVVEDATARSIKVVAAAGNFSDDVSNYVPANMSGVISVGAVTEDGMIADFSNYGKTLTMSVKDAHSTSEATAIVSGYLAGSKKLGSQSDIAGNYTENPKNEKKDTPQIDKDKFVPQGVQFDVNVMYNGAQLGADKTAYKYVDTGVGSAILGRANDSSGGLNGAYFSVAYNGKDHTNSDGIPGNANGTAITDFCSPWAASVYDIQLYHVRPFYGWRITSVTIGGDGKGGKIVNYDPYNGNHASVKVHGDSGYIRIDINVEKVATTEVHLDSHDAATGLTGTFNNGEIEKYRWGDQWISTTEARAWASQMSWFYWAQGLLTPDRPLPGRNVEGFYDVPNIYTSEGTKYYNQDLNGYSGTAGTKYWSPDWDQHDDSIWKDEWPKEITSYGYRWLSGKINLYAHYGYLINLNSLRKGPVTQKSHITINGENYNEVGTADATHTDDEGIDYATTDMPGTDDTVEYSISYKSGINGKQTITKDNLTDFCGTIASPDVYLTINKVDPAYQITKMYYGTFDLIADGTTADPAHGQYVGTYHLRAQNSVDSSKNPNGEPWRYEIDVITEKKPEQSVDVNSTYVVRGTDANGNPTSKEVYAYNVQHNPMKYIEGKQNFGNPEIYGAITKERAEKERNEKEFGTFSAQISGGYDKYDNLADFAGYYPATSTFTISNPVLPSGYTFLGYDVFDKDKNKIKSVTSSEVSASVANSLGVYIRVQGVSYNVNFNSNANGTAGTPNDPQTEMPSGTMTPQTLHYGQLESLKKCGYTWPGHKFLGWSTNPKATKPDTYNVYTVDESQKKDQTTQDPPKDVQLTDGATAFWDYFGKDLGDYAHKDGATITLYAVWETENTTIAVDPSGGQWKNSSAVQTITQKWGTSLNVGTATPKSVSTTILYDFNASDASWDASQPAGVSSSAISSKKDVAQLKFNRWAIIDPSTNIELDLDNGMWGYMRTTSQYVFGANGPRLTAQYYFANVVLPLPQRSDYTFLGWYTDANCTKKAANSGQVYNAPSNGKNQTVTLYARWRKNTFKWSDTLEYNMVDKKGSNPPAVKIRKTDDNGNVLTSVDGKGFKIDISEGSKYDASKFVLRLDTSKGLINKDGKLVISNSSGKYDKTLGWYDISDYLEAGKTYTAHEISAPAGYYLDKDDKTFTVTGTPTTLAKASNDLAAAKTALENAKTSDELKKAQAAYDTAEKALEAAKSSYITLTFTDSTITTPPPSNWKTDPSGRPLKDAEFRLIDVTDNNKVVTTCSTDDGGNLPDDIYSYMTAGHKMQLKETNPPEGYKAITVNFTVPEYPSDTSFLPKSAIDNPNYVNVRIIKKDSSGAVLKGAEFKLYVKTKNGTLAEVRRNTATGVIVTPESSKYADAEPIIATTGNDGVAEFQKLQTRAAFNGDKNASEDTKCYYIVETKAPDGYSISSDPVKVLLPDEDGKTVTYTIVDNKVTDYVLSAGGNGITKYIGAGVAVASAAVILAIIAKITK